jgi:leucyl-tRNA synthetase
MSETSTKHRPFPFADFEPRWQAYWDAHESFRAVGPGEVGFDATRPKFYALDMFPYPSGSGLHVGHPEGYTATDIVSRFKRMSGYNVLHPMGWDAFGLPAEQYAIKTGQHPRTTTEQNVAKFKAQLKRIGFCYDWTREVNTTEPGYFKWTQWIFLQLYESYYDEVTQRARPVYDLVARGLSAAEIDARRLAFVSEAPVNWCPALGTVLANEEVIDGKSEVGGFPVERRPLRQWMLRITAYAQRLIDELDGLDWPESIKLHQRNWIGRSDGAEVHFAVADRPEKITVFTTRPDTLFGATYMVLAPEHPLVDVIAAPEVRAEIEAYRAAIAAKSDLERTELNKDKTGVAIGAFALNPVNGARLPIWIADYVMMGYGTGAIMAVPAHDERDFAFAQKFALPVVQVVQPTHAETPWQGFCGEGIAIHSGFLDGKPTAEAKREMTAYLEREGAGRGTVNFKLRDWLFSRQRYWGEPFPILWEEGQHRAVPLSELPVLPPDLEDFKPTGTPEPPLSKAADWVRYSERATRELNTMPQWAGSCWYYLRYCDPKNSERFISEAADAYWMGRNGTPGGVDLYVGGVEHAVLHLLYARFWHKVLFDLGHVTTPEPFQKLVNQGLILGEMEYSVFHDAGGRAVSLKDLRDVAEEATETGLRMIGFHRQTGEKLIATRVAEDTCEKVGQNFVLKAESEIVVDARSFKMSKSRGNVVNPDDVIAEYGADCLRLYEMFMGPLEQVKPWSMKAIAGQQRFLARVWSLCIDSLGEFSASVVDSEPSPKLRKLMHEKIRKVSDDIERLAFNTAISALMELTSGIASEPVRPVSAIATLLKLLSPFAPHIAEELWSQLATQFPAIRAEASGNAGLCSHQTWPTFDPAALVEDEFELVIQVNGKLRDRLTIATSASQAEIEAAALAAPKVAETIGSATVVRIVIVPRKLVNIVIK